MNYTEIEDQIQKINKNIGALHHTLIQNRNDYATLQDNIDKCRRRLESTIDQLFELKAQDLIELQQYRETLILHYKNCDLLIGFKNQLELCKQERDRILNMIKELETTLGSIQKQLDEWGQVIEFNQ